MPLSVRSIKYVPKRAKFHNTLQLAAMIRNLRNSAVYFSNFRKKCGDMI